MLLNYVRLFKSLAADVGLDSLTVRYCCNRIDNEGIQFLTKTLPNLSKSVLRSLELGHFDRPTDFAWRKGTLRYFRFILNKIFDESTGYVLDDPCPIAIWQLRQVCEYFYKLVTEFSPEQESKAEASYVEVEKQLQELRLSRTWVSSLKKTIHMVFDDISSFTPDDVFSAHRPRFTKGSFSGSRDLRYNSRSSATIPYYLYKKMPSIFTGTCTKEQEGISGYFKEYPSSPVPVSFKEDTGNVAEVLFVPKDSRGPRVISKEPMHLLRTQMSFFDWFSSYLNRKTRSRINFEDQSVNRELARVGSLDKSWTTLDLKEASDRVSLRLCRDLSQHIPVLRYFIRFRSSRYRLPSGKEGDLYKLAGMGSGLTFTFLSFIAYISVVTSILNAQPVRLRNSILNSVYVYGDDLVVPTIYKSLAIQGLENSGLMVNTQKSYSRSNFRESCGGDYFAGNDVCPVRLKLHNAAITVSGQSLVPRNKNNFILQVERHCRVLVNNGLHKVSDFLYTVLESRLGPLPYVSGESPVIGRYVNRHIDYDTDECGNYKAVKCFVPIPKKGHHIGLCPYKALSDKLKPTEVSRLAHLYPDAANHPFEVSVPRRVIIRKQSVSGFRLLA